MLIGKSDDLVDISSAISREYKNAVRFQSLQNITTRLGKVLLFARALIEISHSALTANLPTTKGGMTGGNVGLEWRLVE